MNWDDWIDIPTIKALTQHASGTLAALILFGIVHWVLGRISLSDATRTILVVVDEFCLVGLFLWFIGQMALALWKGRIKNATSSSIVAA